MTTGLAVSAIAVVVLGLAARHPWVDRQIRTRLIDTGWADRAGLWLRDRVRALVEGRRNP